MSSARWMERCNGSKRRSADADFYHGEHRAHRGAFASSFFLHPSYFLKMTLGRTSSGAIKIKTDGGLRAVECSCCGGDCACGSAQPINPDSDPDFTKKLRGDDPYVSPFTSVTIDCSIGVTPSWGDPYSFSGIISGNWVDGGDCTFLGEQVLKFLQTSNCLYGAGCGSYGGCGAAPNNFIGITLLLTASGCLFFFADEEFNFGHYRLTGSSAECNPDAVSSVSINGVDYPTLMGESDFGDPSFGNATITFS